MRRTITAALTLLMCSGAGAQEPKKAKDKPEASIDCSNAKPGNAICYAREVQTMLEEYVSRQEQEVKIRRKSYENSAENYDRDFRWQLDSDLATDRARRAGRLTQALIASRADAWDWRAPLREYMLADRDRMADLMLSDLQNGAADAFVTSLEDLRADVSKAKSTADLVKLLATPRNIKDELEQWLSYGNQVKDEHLKKACDASATKKKAATADRTAKEGQLAAAKAQTPPDPKKIDDLTQAIAADKDQEKALDDYRKAKQCK